MAWNEIAARIRSLLARLRGLVRGARRERELDEELESHLRMHTDDNVRAGMTPDEARRQAAIALGSVPKVTEECRDRRGYPALANLLQDLRYGARALRKNRAFTTVAVLTLGLGVGANTAIFSVVNAVVLQPLPYAEQERLVQVWATNEPAGDREDVASYPDFAEWRSAAKSFAGLAAFTSRAASIDGVDRAELVTALHATPGFFEVLGVAPVLGRSFLEADIAPGAPPVALIADSLWQSRFGRRPNVIGEDLVVNEERRTIVGVLPAGFQFSTIDNEQVYVPRPVDPSRSHGFLRVIGRLRHGSTLRAAQAEMDVIAARIAAAHPDTNEGVGANVVPLATAVAGDARTGLFVILGVVFIVLLIACANVVNLVLARHSTRRRELALRRALGASRWRIVQQLIAESLLLSLCGGAVGLLLSTWGTRILVLGLSGFRVPRIDGAHVDPTVLGFTLLLCVVSGLVFGLAPALSEAAPELAKGLRESSRTTSSRRSRRLQALLIVGETGLALVLLAAAGTLLESLHAMRPSESGLASEHVVVIDFWMPASVATNRSERLRYFEDVSARVGATHGVRSTALVATLPLSGGADTLDFHIKGRPDPAPDEAWSANFNIASAGYFSTMSIPLLAGREFTADDRATTRRAIVVNQSAARHFWPDENPLGREIDLAGPGEKSAVAAVIGVVGDVRQANLGTPARPEIYLAMQQPGPDWPHLTLVARTDAEAAKLAGALKDVAQSVDRNIPVAAVHTLREVLERSLAEARLFTALLAVFAGLAILLAAVGLYGVVSYSVAQRTSEIGIRLALGAERSRVIRAVLAQALRLSLAGSVLGLVGAAASVRVLLSLFDGVRAGGPLTLAAVALLLNAVALGAGYLPARRASRIDPAVALRNE